ncbi:MAG: hypothetical protein H7335_03480 [Massilia sp.]|nr:hypothetical protein [Massilia sp.]
MQVIMAFVVGVLFGIGLIVAGMTDPSKVQGFLDLAGHWNPSLAYVTIGSRVAGTANVDCCIKATLLRVICYQL